MSSGASATPSGTNQSWEVISSIATTPVENSSAKDPTKRSMQFEDEEHTAKSPRSTSPAPPALPAVVDGASESPGDLSVQEKSRFAPVGAASGGTPLSVGAYGGDLSGGGRDAGQVLDLDTVKTPRIDQAPARACEPGEVGPATMSRTDAVRLDGNFFGGEDALGKDPADSATVGLGAKSDAGGKGGYRGCDHGLLWQECNKPGLFEVEVRGTTHPQDGSSKVITGKYICKEHAREWCTAAMTAAEDLAKNPHDTHWAHQYYSEVAAIVIDQTDVDAIWGPDGGASNDDQSWRLEVAELRAELLEANLQTNQVKEAATNEEHRAKDMQNRVQDLLGFVTVKNDELLHQENVQRCAEGEIEALRRQLGAMCLESNTSRQLTAGEAHQQLEVTALRFGEVEARLQEALSREAEALSSEQECARIRIESYQGRLQDMQAARDEDSNNLNMQRANYELAMQGAQEQMNQQRFEIEVLNGDRAKARIAQCAEQQQAQYWQQRHRPPIQCIGWPSCAIFF